MRVLVLGGDGYLGWPTAMHLSAKGHDVYVVDNYLRRNISREENVEALYETPNLHERAKRWKEVSGRDMRVFIADLSEWEKVSEVFQDFMPECIVHYAEQPSAPYSMMNHQAALLTLRNNIEVTGNVIHATIKYCPDAHIIKLGTMGEYGTPDIDIEEGWIEIEHNGRSDRFLYPRQAGSLYHTTKIMDTDLLWLYVRMNGLRVTDLMQGPVYGMHTEETHDYPELLPFFNYDELFGTVINRFVAQAVAGYPLTVYGKGGQTRGYLNIVDTLQCVRLALENPPACGELRILNQITETFTVNELAEKVRSAGEKIGLQVKIQSIENPRKEAEEHYYNPKYTGLQELGLKPTLLSDDVLIGMLGMVMHHKDRIDMSKFMSGRSRWK